LSLRCSSGQLSRTGKRTRPCRRVSASAAGRGSGVSREAQGCVLPVGDAARSITPALASFVFRHSVVPDNLKHATLRRRAETSGGAGRGREEAFEVARPDREEATHEAEATEEDLARQVTTARLRPFSCRLAASRAGQASGRALDPPWAQQIRPHPRPSRRPSLSQNAGTATGPIGPSSPCLIRGSTRRSVGPSCREEARQLTKPARVVFRSPSPSFPSQRRTVSGGCQLRPRHFSPRVLRRPREPSSRLAALGRQSARLSGRSSTCISLSYCSRTLLAFAIPRLIR
jgi:hypothetical protein